MSRWTVSILLSMVALFGQALWSTADFDCRPINNLTAQETAQELYKEAFNLSFTDDIAAAETASLCSAILSRGETRWPIDARSLME